LFTGGGQNGGNLIKIEGLVKSYGAIEVLHGIELAVQAGELFVNLARNSEARKTC